MKPLTSIALILFVSLFSVTPVLSQQKKVIKSQDDVPRFTYELPTSASAVFASKESMDALVVKLQADYEKMLQEYDIQDKTLLKGIYGTLKNIDLYNEQYEKGLKKVKKIRELQEKPSDRLMSGLSNMAYLKALQETNHVKNERFHEKFKQYFSESVNQLPWDVVQDDVESTKGSLEIYSENLVLGIIKERIDPGVVKSGKISDDNASTLVNMNYISKHFAQYKLDGLIIISLTDSIT